MTDLTVLNGTTRNFIVWIEEGRSFLAGNRLTEFAKGFFPVGDFLAYFHCGISLQNLNVCGEATVPTMLRNDFDIHNFMHLRSVSWRFDVT
jgi:hypothetical protein